jgi:uncharacterized protein (TIGR03435 family)
VERLYRLKFEECSHGGTFISAGTPLMWSITFAYRIDDKQVAGAPDWVKSFDSAYEIEGKPEGPVSKDECRQMARALLADRFKLAVHESSREQAVYTLVAGKNGSKMRAVDEHSPPAGVRMNGAVMQSPSEEEAPPGWTMAVLAGYLSGFTGRPVVDRTGLEGRYAMSLSFSRKDGDEYPNVFTAVQEQLGLKMEPARAAMKVLVIDHVEKPGEN